MSWRNKRSCTSMWHFWWFDRLGRWRFGFISEWIKNKTWIGFEFSTFIISYTIGTTGIWRRAIRFIDKVQKLFIFVPSFTSLRRDCTIGRTETVRIGQATAVPRLVVSHPFFGTRGHWPRGVIIILIGDSLAGGRPWIIVFSISWTLIYHIQWIYIVVTKRYYEPNSPVSMALNSLEFYFGFIGNWVPLCSYIYFWSLLTSIWFSLALTSIEKGRNWTNQVIRHFIPSYVIF